VTILVGAFAVAVVVLGERFLPFCSEWRESRGDVATDVWHGIVSNLAFPPFIKAMLLLCIAPFATLYSAPWPSRWPLALQLILAALLAELSSYWAHRTAHEHDALWRLHATHHSAERLYWLNAGRDHPFGLAVLFTAEILPLVLLGAGERVLAAYALFTVVLGLFQHANIDLRLGPLNWVFSSAELHRWHHSRDVSEANHNYGSNLIVWDIVFGTRMLPVARPPVAVGIGNMPNFPRNYLGQLLVPFRWRKLARTEKSESNERGSSWALENISVRSR
jgi:ornithine lipid hydroxylase